MGKKRVVKVAELWGAKECYPDAAKLGETQLLGFHLETQALHDEETVAVLFTRRYLVPCPPPSILASLSHQRHFPPLSSNIHNNRLFHPPTLAHPLPSSWAPQAPNLAHISLFPYALPPLLQPSPPPSNPILCLSVSLSLIHSLFSLPSADHIPWVYAVLFGWWGGGYRCQCFDPMKADIQNRATDPATGHPGIWTTWLCLKAQWGGRFPTACQLGTQSLDRWSCLGWGWPYEENTTTWQTHSSLASNWMFTQCRWDFNFLPLITFIDEWNDAKNFFALND